MKKTLIGAAIIGSLSSIASAQSSVTLYGTLDAGVSYVNNESGHSNWQLSDGGLDASRWGIVGSEDLGAGRKAIFQLENGFDVSNGRLAQDARMFGRQAFVGLSDNALGSITLGRQYDSVVDYLAPFTETGSTGGLLFAHPYDNDNTRNALRINNSIKYSSQVFAGFSFGGVYGFSNQAGGFAQNRAYSIGAKYQNGPVKIAAAYMQLSRPGSSTGAVDTTLFGPGTLEVAGAIDPAVDFRQRTYGVGASYDVGPATVRASWTHTSLTDIALSASGQRLFNDASAKFDNYEVNARYHVTPALAVDAMYTYTRGKVSITGDGSSAHWHTLGLQSTYALSKRTDLYLAGVYQKASNGVSAQLYGSAESSTDSQVGVTAGVRHRF